MRFKKFIKNLILPILSVFLLFGITSCDNNIIDTFDDLNKPNIRIGTHETLLDYDKLQIDYPNAKVYPYTNAILGYNDVIGGKLDAFVHSKVEMQVAINSGLNGAKILEKSYNEYTVAIGISRKAHIPNIKDKVNEFIDEIKSNGTFDDMFNRWIVKKDDTMIDVPKAENPSLTIKVATAGTLMPYSYYSGNKLVGFDIELANRFAYFLNANIEFKVIDFGGIIAAASTGDVDCIFSDLYQTEENSQAIDFSKELYKEEIGVLVRDTATKKYYKSLSELAYARISVQTGTIFDDHVLEALPNATIVYDQSTANQIATLESGKVDAVAADEPTAINMMHQNPKLALIPEVLKPADYAYAFPKSDKGKHIRDQFNVFLAKCYEDGTIDNLKKKWLEDFYVSDIEYVDYNSLINVNGVINVCVLESPPLGFTYTNSIQGYDVELLALFAKEYGYRLEMSSLQPDALVAGVISGKYDCGIGGITVTEEREQSMLFSDCVYDGGSVLLVLKDTETEQSNFFVSIGESFEKTFIREERWKLFIEGIITTLTITVLSIIFGTLLGFGAFLTCRKGNKIANLIARFLIWLVQGMPVVLLLMILYYIVFGNVSISGTIVSIIGFTLIFGAGVFNMVKLGVGTIDKGQFEAASALGFSESRTFFTIILPQALPNIIPIYKGEITSLIKATAIVGYVAVQDLTKVGDIIRSRTFEAFFPLIAIAIIYFLLAALLNFIVKKIEIRVDPKTRSIKKVLKGVKRNDRT